MTAEEKAQELVDKFLHPVRWKMGQEDIAQRAKQCALIAVDEIIRALWDFFYKNCDRREPAGLAKEYEYWNEVKQEIEKL